jgi:hypothetical protein
MKLRFIRKEKLIGSTLLSTRTRNFEFGAFPIYIFLILLYKSLFVKFFAKLFGKNTVNLFDIRANKVVVKVTWSVNVRNDFIVLTIIGLMIIGVE